ncbi:site-specific integrase [uncultured Arcobacter sp.]|uniref:tyrosine-type recombinase/integrase n=1 Tax=uncultured Arcobacter sp. TaxID=165434 RepID=UPI00262D0609|nr:site-specific integrase [uncultured Arcobacter sp.]
MKDQEGSYLQQREVQALLDRASKANDGGRNFLILLLLLRTGRRIGELLELKPKDIRFDDENDISTGMITWNIEKKYKKVKDDSEKGYHTIKTHLRKSKPLDKQAMMYLLEYIRINEIGPDDYVFSSPYLEDRHLSRVAVWIFLSKYAKELGIKVHPHSFRHTFSIMVTRQMKNPADLKKLSNLLEHSDMSITESYLQFAPKESRDLLKATFLSPDEEE